MAKLLHLLQTPWPQPEDAARVRRVGTLTLWAETLVVQTAPRAFLDITDEVLAVVQRAAIQQGWVSIFCKHTTAVVVIKENDSDLASRLSSGHASGQQCLTGGGQSVPVAEGKLDLGTRQRILVLELDEAGTREVVVQALGA